MKITGAMIEAEARRLWRERKAVRLHDCPAGVTPIHVADFLAYLEHSPVPDKVFEKGISMHASGRALMKDYPTAREAAEFLLATFIRSVFGSWLCMRGLADPLDFIFTSEGIAVSWQTPLETDSRE